MSNTFIKLIKNSILHNKLRSFLICLSISISIALITGVNLLITSSLALTEGVEVSTINGTAIMLYLLSVVVGLVIIIFIYSIFKVFVMENIPLYGMLRGIGIRRSKLVYLVLLEGLFYGVIAIPIGLVLGILLCKGFVALSTSYLSFNSIDFPITITASSIKIPVIYGLVSIILSVIFPALKASKVSPVEAISSFGTSQSISSEGYLPDFLKKLLNYKWKLAFSDINKNKSKAALIIAVFSISLILVITLSATYSFRDEFGKKTKVHLYDFEIDSANGFDEDYISQLKANPMVEAVNATDDATAWCKVNVDKLNPSNLGYKYAFQKGDEATVLTFLVAYDDELLKECKKFIVSGDMDLENPEDQFIAFVNERPFSEEYELFSSGPLVNFNSEDEVTLDISDFGIKDTTYEGKITSIINDLPASPIMNPFEHDLYFIVSNETYNKIVGKNRITNLLIRLKTNSDEKKMENFIKEEIKEGRISRSSNMIEFLRSIKRDDEFVKYTILFFTFMLFLVGIIININLIIGNIISKEKQFLIYKAIGIKQKQVNRIILIELLFYVILSISIGLLFGIPLSKFVFFRFVEVIGLKVYKFPYFDVGLYMLLMLISTITAYVISIRQIKKSLTKHNKVD